MNSVFLSQTKKSFRSEITQGGGFDLMQLKPEKNPVQMLALNPDTFVFQKPTKTFITLLLKCTSNFDTLILI